MKPEGFVLIMVLALMIVLISLVGGFLYATSILVLNNGWEETDAKVLWLAEAGLQKGIWYLKTPAPTGKGEDWPSSSTQTLTENLGDGSYTMVVARWDFALSSNSSTASATSSVAGHAASSAIDNNDTTYWESSSVPTPSNSQELTVTFPYALTLNKVRFLVPFGSTNNHPRRYSWNVSSDGSSWNTVLDHTSSNNSSLDVTDVFSAASNVRYLQLHVERTGSGSAHVRIATLEAIGSKITSTGSITAGGNTITRVVSQTVVTDSDSPQNQVAYYEPDWVEQ